MFAFLVSSSLSHYFALFSLYRQADKSLHHHPHHHHHDDDYNDPWACNEICWGTWLSSYSPHSSSHCFLCYQHRCLATLLLFLLLFLLCGCCYIFSVERPFPTIRVHCCLVAPHVTSNDIFILKKGNCAQEVFSLFLRIGSLLIEGILLRYT